MMKKRFELTNENLHKILLAVLVLTLLVLFYANRGFFQPLLERAGDPAANAVFSSFFWVLLATSAVLFVMHLLKCDELLMMGVLLAVLLICYALILPNGVVPDEESHFTRSFSIATSRLLPLMLKEHGGGGDWLPSGVLFFKDPARILNYNDIWPITFVNTALYSPVNYIAQAAGIRVGMLFTMNVSKVFTAGRIAGMILSYVLCMLALYWMPFGRRLMFCVMVFPVSLQEMISLSPDGFIIGLSLLWTALILHLWQKAEKITVGQMIGLAVMGIVLSQCKIVYIVLLLLIFLIPNRLFSSRKLAIGFKAGLFALAVILNLLWLSYSVGFLIEYRPGVDSGAQVKYLLSNPLRYMKTLVWTALNTSIPLLQNAMGRSVAGLDEMQDLIWFPIWNLFLFLLLFNRETVKRPKLIETLLLIATLAGGILLICTSLYVQWTPVGAELIDGLQGRYFFPFMGVAVTLFLLLKQVLWKADAERPQQKASYMYFILLFCNAVTLQSVFARLL
ncbi:MAG: DUF2142 domain-containing protein [Lachnospiraceae bacterium]|nr:DUF2142 domain-containing protein [Lachnospiraceae bacterium]